MVRTRDGLAAVLLSVLLAASACDTGLTAVNENPNAPTDVDAAYLMAQSIQAAVRETFGGGGWQGLMLSYTSLWTQQFVELQYPIQERGQVYDTRAFWDAYYTGPLPDIQTVIGKAAESGNVNLEAMGRIWKAWIFHIVTDLWGDVPYFEALQGPANTTPPYDPQADIYPSLLTELATAQDALDPNSASVDEGDLLYRGDLTAWRRFANSLRMRLAMRLSEVDLPTAEAQFVAAYDAGGFDNNEDNAMLQYPGPPYQNPLYENYLWRDDHGVSATMIDTLKSLNDPRLALYAEPAAIDGEYRGHQNGRRDLPPGQSLEWFSRIGNFWRANGASTPAPIMTFAEVRFLEAEAVVRGWIAGDAAALYTEAIQASMDLYDDYGVGPSDAEIAAYLAQPRVTYDPAIGLGQIYLQKWIALWMNGSEVWAEWRRTGVPNLAMGPDLIVSRIPVRLPYPPIEESLNGANLRSAVDRQGGGRGLVTPVWWDVD